ncbi:electron transport complex protein RnfG [Cohaesibacter sp. ES.047]|uniref:electron transport complex subunit RsxG n=1 Tax=Cohaesibacter sp. ES.047 TaxID=1798205 RepID=UPI000BC08665|nr:electron transport complex subunit RsxG [Cohaesibacter sp. ES.047]SNY92902.1 electron transport complex protein RnfG [Cohaesibacter sp. ES.047]
MSRRNKTLIRSVGMARRLARKAGSIYDRIRGNPAYLATLLGGFSLVTAFILASSHMATEAAIQQRQKEDLQGSLSLVIPSALHDNDLVRDSYVLADAGGVSKRIYPATVDGELTAVAYQVTGLGYGGPILALLGVDRDGTILGVRVLQHAETPGLGDKIEANRSDWIKSFTGQSFALLSPDQWEVKKDGGYFDQLSGATITPRAVVQSVKGGISFFTSHMDELLEGGHKAEPNVTEPIKTQEEPS